MLMTPGGMPASISSSIVRDAASCWVGLGFQTTVLPAARAGASFQAGMRIGKFHGVITPTTPSGARTVRMVSPGTLLGKIRSLDILAMAAW